MINECVVENLINEPYKITRILWKPSDPDWVHFQVIVLTGDGDGLKAKDFGLRKEHLERALAMITEGKKRAE